MLDSLKFYHKRIKEGVLKDMWRETVWIYEYARKYWKQMIFYTLLGLSGTVVSLISSLISRDMVDIITGKQAGLLVRTFCLYIGFSIGNMLISQVTSYFSNKISISVDNDIKADIFDKMLVTDLEAIQKYHTGDLLNTLEFGCLKHFKWYFKLDSESDHIYCAVYQYVCACLLQ